MSEQATEPKPEGKTVPVEDWIPHPVSDSAEYLDGPGPQYGDELTGAAKEQFDAALQEREKKLAGHKPREKRTLAARKPRPKKT